MDESHAFRPDRDGALLWKLHDDPWSLTPAERDALRHALDIEQDAWLQRLAAIAEPPALDDSFPAFLLATEPFAWVAEAVAGAADDTGARDVAQRFVDRYRGYLTEAGATSPLETSRQRR